MPKLLYIGTLPPHQGGSAINSARVLAGLADLGWSVRAIGPITPEQAAAGDPFAEAHPRVAVTRFPVPYEETNAYEPAGNAYRDMQTERLLQALRAAMGRERADVIVIGRESFAWQVPALAKAYATPVVLLARGLILSIAGGAYPAELGPPLLAEIGKTDLVIAMAEHMAATIKGLGITPCLAIPNGVDAVKFQPRPKSARLLAGLRIPGDAVVALHPSNLNPVKRPLDLIESAARILPAAPKLTYLVVGDGPCRVAMEQACADHGIADRFRFTGWVEPAAMPDYYAIADLVVMPSASEGLAMASLEAQASGLALLASDIPASREIITDGETGCLFPVGDVDALARRTLALAQDPAARARLGGNARTAVAAERRFTDCLAGYAAAFEGLIARGGGG